MPTTPRPTCRPSGGWSRSRVEAVDHAVQVSVSDQGRGIAVANRDQVFDAFFTTKPNGVGIGLAISRSIIEDHGGRLWLEGQLELRRYVSISRYLW